jgi:FeS assembly SUF system regulator
MIRLTKLTDYGLLLMCQIARAPFGNWHTARELANECRLPLPTVSKLLRNLLQNGLLVSHRGIKGGYVLAREPELIPITEIIAALEGPFALTECGSEDAGLCDLESCCPVKDNQRVISHAIRAALERVMLSDLTRPMQLTTIRDNKGEFVAIAGATTGRMQ